MNGTATTDGEEKEASDGIGKLITLERKGGIVFYSMALKSLINQVDS